jgi:pimeloyl-ACP methyl ester carboxylesterase
MSTVKVNDVTIYYETHGQGEPLVLIMGYGANCQWWYPQIPVFSQEYRVIAFDNRGSGQSDKPDIPYTIEMMAEDTAGLLEAIGVNAAHVFGVSMGGMIAQEFALRYPQKVISLILCCTTPGGRNSVIPDEEAMTFLSDMERRNGMTLEEQARELLPFLFTQKFIDENQKRVDEFIAGMLEYVTPLHGYQRQWGAIMGFNAYDRLPQIKTPTLVISGTTDRLIPVENSRIIASRIPGAELVIFENMGHGFLAEALKEANKTVLDFLRRHRCGVIDAE